MKKVGAWYVLGLCCNTDVLVRHGVSDKRMRMVSTAILFCIYVLLTR